MMGTMAIEAKPVHPAAAFFPMMGEKVLAELVQSMRSDGYDERHPILLYEGQILDGRNRELAARAAGVEPMYEEVLPGENPFAVVLRENAMRRDLAFTQRQAIVLKLSMAVGEWFQLKEARAEAANRARSEAADSRRGEGGRLEAKPSTSAAAAAAGQGKAGSHPTAEALAKLAGGSRGTAERVLEAASDPEILDRLARGEISAREARRLVRAKKKAASIAAGESPKRKREVSPELAAQDERVRALYMKRMTAREVAAELGLKASEVDRAIYRLGLKKGKGKHRANPLAGLHKGLKMFLAQFEMWSGEGELRQRGGTPQQYDEALRLLGQIGSAVRELQRVLKEERPC